LCLQDRGLAEHGAKCRREQVHEEALGRDLAEALAAYPW
jgi:hypothetical protein